MRASGALAAGAMEYLAGIRVVGRTEVEVALDLEFWAASTGSEGDCFPHHRGPRGTWCPAACGAAERDHRPGATARCGTWARWSWLRQRHHAHVCYRSLSQRELEMYQVVKRRRPPPARGSGPVVGGGCDRLARDVVESAGMGDLFEHSLGHGVGLRYMRHRVWVHIGGHVGRATW